MVVFLIDCQWEIILINRCRISSPFKNSPVFVSENCWEKILTEMDKNRFCFWRCQKYFNPRAQFVFPNKPSFFNWEVFNIFLRFYKHPEFAAQKKNPKVCSFGFSVYGLMPISAGSCWCPETPTWACASWPPRNPWRHRK